MLRALLIIAALAGLAGCGEYKTIGIYTLPGDYRVTIEQKTEWEIAPTSYYTISQHGREIIPRTFFGGAFGSFSDLTVLDSGHGVVALAPTSLPSSVIILFNVRTCESYPYRAAKEQHMDAYEKGLRMLQTLKKNPVYANSDFGD